MQSYCFIIPVKLHKNVKLESLALMELGHYPYLSGIHSLPEFQIKDEYLVIIRDSFF